MKPRASGLWSNGLYSYRRTGKRLGSPAQDANTLRTNLARERAALLTSWAGSRCETVPTGNMGKSSARPDGCSTFSGTALLSRIIRPFRPNRFGGSAGLSVNPTIRLASSREHPRLSNHNLRSSACRSPLPLLYIFLLAPVRQGDSQAGPKRSFSRPFVVNTYRLGNSVSRSPLHRSPRHDHRFTPSTQLIMLAGTVVKKDVPRTIRISAHLARDESVSRRVLC